MILNSSRNSHKKVKSMDLKSRQFIENNEKTVK